MGMRNDEFLGMGALKIRPGKFVGRHGRGGGARGLGGRRPAAVAGPGLAGRARSRWRRRAPPRPPQRTCIVPLSSLRAAQGSRGPGSAPPAASAAPRARRTALEGPDGVVGAARAGPRRYARHRPFLHMGWCLTCRGGPVQVLFRLLEVFSGAGCLGGGLGGVGTRVNHFGARLIICAEKGPKTALFGVDLGGFWDVTRRVWARSTRHKCEKSF